MQAGHHIPTWIFESNTDDHSQAKALGRSEYKYREALVDKTQLAAPHNETHTYGW